MLSKLKEFVKKIPRIYLLIGFCSITTLFINGRGCGCLPNCELELLEPDNELILETKCLRSQYLSGWFDTLRVRLHLGIPDKDKNRDGYLYFVLVRHRDYFGNSDTSRIRYRSDEIVHLSTHSAAFETTATLYFTQFAWADSYDVYGVIRLAEEETKGTRQTYSIVIVDEGDSVIDAIGPGGGRLTIYAGNNQIGNIRDTFNIPYAYPIALRLIDTLGQGIDGDTFKFKCPGAYFGGAYQSDSCRVISTTRIYLDTTLSGFVIPSALILSNSYGSYVLTIQWLKSGEIVAEKEMKFTVINDLEQSGLTPPNCHETTDSINKNVEIPGDGYDDGAGQKTIKLEIDYDGGIYSYTSVELAAVYCESILTTAKVSPDIIIDQDVGAIPDENSSLGD
ncbi:MAG: hypothetical protein ABIL02_06930 [candidate division WOR-3 bacterium]